MMNKLPADVITNIKAFASDKLPPTPTAKLIKTLQFEYKDTIYDNDIYRPHRLEVTAAEGRFDFLDQSEPAGSRINLVYSETRELIISNFLPSYWSIYANTIDR